MEPTRVFVFFRGEISRILDSTSSLKGSWLGKDPEVVSPLTTSLKLINHVGNCKYHFFTSDFKVLAKEQLPV